MITAESIKIDSDDGRYVLAIDTVDDGTITIDIHACVLDFYDDFRSEVARYAHDYETARSTMPQPVLSTTDDVYEAIDAGYALDDPKSPGYHDRMVD